MATGQLRSAFERPKRPKVTLYGDWMPVGKPEPMQKGSEGVWSVITAPLEANGHLYCVNLEGRAVADPVNPVIKVRQRTSASLVEVPAATPAPWELRDVPHGTVVTEWRKSAVLGRTERIVIYLPPGYEKAAAKYPVLYLVHGSGDTPESWTKAGHANLILHNLIADGKARPMIVVMPAGHAVPFGAGRGGVNANNNQLFEEYLTKEVIPAIEGTYRVMPGVRNRALAGLSMGGGHTIYTGFSHPDLFQRSRHFQPGGCPAISMSLARIIQTFRWCGSPAVIRTRPFSIRAVKAWSGIAGQIRCPREVHHVYSGAHTWPVWRMSLADFAPLIFKNGK